MHQDTKPAWLIAVSKCALKQVLIWYVTNSKLLLCHKCWRKHTFFRHPRFHELWGSYRNGLLRFCIQGNNPFFCTFNNVLHSITVTVFDHDFWSILPYLACFLAQPQLVYFSSRRINWDIPEDLYVVRLRCGLWFDATVWKWNCFNDAKLFSNNAKYKHFKTLLWRYRYSVWERRGHPDRRCRTVSGFVWQRRHKVVLRCKVVCCVGRVEIQMEI